MRPPEEFDEIFVHLGIEAGDRLNRFIIELKEHGRHAVAQAIAEELRSFEEFRAELEQLRAEVKTLHGPTGQAGKDGEPGKDGAPGRDGLPGLPGRDGLKGAEGAAGKDGLNGIDGKDGTVDYGILADLHKGIWKPGEYKRGELIAFGGSMLIARRDTSAKPETPEAANDWQLIVKRGRDGKDGKDGAKGEKGSTGPMGIYKGLD